MEFTFHIAKSWGSTNIIVRYAVDFDIEGIEIGLRVNENAIALCDISVGDEQSFRTASLRLGRLEPFRDISLQCSTRQ